MREIALSEPQAARYGYVGCYVPIVSLLLLRLGVSHLTAEHRARGAPYLHRYRRVLGLSVVRVVPRVPSFLRVCSAQKGVTSDGTIVHWEKGHRAERDETGIKKER